MALKLLLSKSVRPVLLASVRRCTTVNAPPLRLRQAVPADISIIVPFLDDHFRTGEPITRCMSILSESFIFVVQQ